MKKILIIFMAIIMVLNIIGCRTANTIPEQKTFNITLNELVERLNSESMIDLTNFSVIDDKDGSKIATYTFSTENDYADTLVHYQIDYDDTTKKIYHINFFFSKNFMGDITNARTRYFYHIAAIAETLNPNVNIDDLYDKISTVNGINESSSETYENDVFNLLAYCHDEYFSASFEPVEK